LEPDENKYEFELPIKRKYYPTKVRRTKIISAIPLIVTMIVMVVVATFCVLSVRLLVQYKNSFAGSIVGGILNGITIIILNVVWRQVAIKLNDWENYRTETEYENNLIIKLFAFYFVNSYTSLYYMAFFKRNNQVFDLSVLQDGCNAGVDDMNIISNGCVDEVMLQLGCILAVNMFVGQAQEVALPWIMGKVQLIREIRKTGEDKKKVPIWERDAVKSDFEGTLDEYAEMVIQFGYITLFAATFPVAPLMAVLNNIIEIRTDAFKILSSFPRPLYRGAQNIGTWYWILELLGIVAVMTNCALIGLSFDIIIQYTQNPFQTLGIVVMMEHVILALKFLIAFLIPDLPGWIVKKMAYEDYIKNATLKNLMMKTHVKPTFNTGGEVLELNETKNEETKEETKEEGKSTEIGTVLLENEAKPE